MHVVYSHKRTNPLCRMVADLLAGVYYQKCYDPECRRINYRSQSNLQHIVEGVNVDNEDTCIIHTLS